MVTVEDDLSVAEMTDNVTEVELGQSPPPPIDVWYVLVEVGVGVLASLGNALVIYAFTTNRRLRKLTNYYIVSLAIADLLVGLLGIPFAILTYMGLPPHHLSCLFTLSVLIILCTTSILCLLAVSVDRYWAVMRPLDYQRMMNGKIAIRIIIVCWVLSAVIGLVPLMGWHSGKMENFCLFVEVMSYSYLVFLYFATIIFPGILMACFYLHIYVIVVRRMKALENSFHKTGSSGTSLPFRGRVSSTIACGPPRRGDIKAAKSLSVIVVFFMICWLPLYTINCINAFCPDCSIAGPFLDATIILTHANSAVNPFLYALNMKDFRREMKNIIRRMFRKPPEDIRIVGSPSLPLRSIHEGQRPGLGRQVTFEDPRRAAGPRNLGVMWDTRTTNYVKFPPRRKQGAVCQLLENVLLILLHVSKIPTRRQTSNGVQEQY